jgi:hypothetical protein
VSEVAIVAAVAKAQAQLAIWKNLDGDDPLARSVRGA